MSPDPPAADSAEQLVRGAEQRAIEHARTELFFREFALHLAKQATREYALVRGRVGDGAQAVQEYLSHERRAQRISEDELTASGQGLFITARAHACPYQQTCQNNLQDLGEVPQCVRAITLIQAIGARIPERPPMTYDLRPGLVDGTGPSCEIKLRPAGLPDLEPIRAPSGESTRRESRAR